MKMTIEKLIDITKKLDSFTQFKDALFIEKFKIAIELEKIEIEKVRNSIFRNSFGEYTDKGPNYIQGIANILGYHEGIKTDIIGMLAEIKEAIEQIKSID